MAVEDGGNSADDLITFLREKETNLRLREERVLTGEELSLLKEKGGDPVGVAAVDLPGEMEEGIEVAVSGYGEDFHDQITLNSLPTLRKASRTRSKWAGVWVAM